MNKNIDEISSEIAQRIDSLVDLIRVKHNKTTPAMQARPHSITAAYDALRLASDLLLISSPFTSIKALAEENASSINPKPICLKNLNKLKPSLFKKLFADESLLEASDFPESQRDSYRSISQIRKFLQIFDNILGLITNYRILEHYFLLPKTTIELEWDALDSNVHEYNDVLNVLKKDKKLKYKSTSENQLISKFSQNIFDSILRYIEPTQLIEISHNHALSRYFETKKSIDQILPPLLKTGFVEEVFIYINPLVLSVDADLQRTLKQVLDEGFHVSLFKTLDPKRLVKIPRFDVPSMQESVEEGADVKFNNKAWWISHSHTSHINYLTPEIFPKDWRAIRGKDHLKRPFISILNSDENAVTFFQRYTDKTLTWTVGSNASDKELRVMVSEYINLKESRGNIENQIEYVHDSTPGHVRKSFAKYEEWIALFLGYINASCLKLDQDGQPVNLDVLKSLSDSLKYIRTDQYPLVDRAEYPDRDLPHDRVSRLG